MPVGEAFRSDGLSKTPAWGRPLPSLSRALWGVPHSRVQLPSLLADLWPP